MHQEPCFGVRDAETRWGIAPAFGLAVGACLLAAEIAHAQPPTDLFTTEIATSPAGGYLSGMLPSPAPDDNHLYLVARPGFVYRADNNGEGSLETFINISSLTTTVSERGLLSIAFHPSYGTDNTWVFLNYTNTSGDTVVGRITMDLSDPSEPVAGPVETVMLIPQDSANHNGGQIAFGNDGMLYIGMGDGGGGNDPNCRAQDPGSLLGKMLRVDVDQPTPSDPLYTVPADNPFVGDPSFEDEIWAYGLRNPWRFSIDPVTGELWIADVGQSTREEVNRVDPVADAGANFGWPVREGDTCNGSTVFVTPCANAGVALPSCPDASLLDPVHVYPTGAAGNISITGGFVYRGSTIPDLQGYYLFGDFGSGRIWAMDPDTADVTEVFELGFGVTTFGVDGNGEILIGWGSSVLRLESESAVTGAESWLLYD